MSIVQNLLKKIRNILKTFGFKSLGLGMFKYRSRLDFLLRVSVSKHHCLVLISKILAGTPTLIFFLLSQESDSSAIFWTNPLRNRPFASFPISFDFFPVNLLHVRSHRKAEIKRQDEKLSSVNLTNDRLKKSYYKYSNSNKQ